MKNIYWLINQWQNRLHRSLSVARAWGLRFRGAKMGSGVMIDRAVEVFFPVRMEIGSGCKVLSNVRIKCAQEGFHEKPVVLRIGNNVNIGNGTVISAGHDVSIGSDTLIAAYCFIIDANHVFADSDILIRKQGGDFAPVRIGSNVWIAAHCVILPGVTIGDGAVIGANSTVTKDVPPMAIAVGSPAKVIKFRSGKTIV